MSGDTPRAVLEDLKDVFEEKNEDYSNSWEKVGAIKRVIADQDGPEVVTLSPGKNVSKTITGEHAGQEWYMCRVPMELLDERGEVEAVVLADTPQTTSTFQQNADDVITRLLDKLVRAYNLVFLKDEPALDNESTVDAVDDLTGYSSMLASLVRRAR